MMKKIIVFLSVFLCPALLWGWSVNWNDVTGEDGYILKHKPYPSGFSYPDNPAPHSLITDMDTANAINLPADTVQWEIPETSFTEGQRYVFTVQATRSGSVSGYSDAVCWTYPLPMDVIELPIDSGTSIQINIYQVP